MYEEPDDGLDIGAPDDVMLRGDHPGEEYMSRDRAPEDLGPVEAADEDLGPGATTGDRLSAAATAGRQGQSRELPTFADWEAITAGELPEVDEARRAEARAGLRARFPELTEADLDEVSSQTTKTSKFEIFVQRLMEKYKWSRGVCHQQVAMGAGDDIRDC